MKLRKVQSISRIFLFRLLLWDCDDRSYSYYIEVSNNKSDWELVFDRSKQPCKSWQHITFPRRPFVMIRIVGTHNTANEVFHCVHFEAPAVTNVMRIEDKSDDLSVDEEDDENENANNQNESKDVEGCLDDGENGGQVNSMQDFEANFNEAKDDAFSHVSIHSSPSSNAGSVSAGQSGIPMGASACSMARASSGLRQSSMQMSSRDSPSSSPVLFEAAPVGGGGPSGSRSANYPRHHGGSAPSLTAAQSVTNSPVRAVSVDEAASLALANLLEIDETQSNGGQGGGTASTSSAAAASATRRYQHALSVRVPPNQHGNGNPTTTTTTNPTPAASATTASSSNGTAASSGAVPRRQSRSSSTRSQNQSEERSV